MKDVVFLDLANKEMSDAASYYDDHSPGLGFEFLDEIEYTIERIRVFPESGKKVRNKVRRKLTRRFPFGILYIDDKNEILIVAVMHLHRRPDYWIDRLENI